jgi:hypothetical protein
MQAEQWLLLTDYASKHRISVSTLRRRIKAGQIPHRFENGKYFILDAGPSIGEAEVRPGEFHLHQPRPPSQLPFPTDSSVEDTQASVEEPIISTATKLLNELKKAYMNILQEKEEQIIQLKEEVTDLKTLVRVLEDDNERLRRALQSYPQPHA